MLKDLQDLHERAIGLMDELEQLTRGPRPEEAELARVRWKLTQASAERHTLLEQVIYPALARQGSAADRILIEKLSADGRAARQQSAQHVCDWNLKRIAEQWEAYAERSRTMRTTMLAQIAKEREQLVRMLQRSRPEEAPPKLDRAIACPPPVEVRFAGRHPIGS
jgi:hypothetical protein